MKRDDIIRMVSEAGICDRPFDFQMASFQDLERFAAIVAAAERDAILGKATKANAVDGHCDIVLAADIRARSTP